MSDLSDLDSFEDDLSDLSYDNEIGRAIKELTLDEVSYDRNIIGPKDATERNKTNTHKQLFEAGPMDDKNKIKALRAHATEPSKERRRRRGRGDKKERDLTSNKSHEDNTNIKRVILKKPERKIADTDVNDALDKATISHLRAVSQSPSITSTPNHNTTSLPQENNTLLSYNVPLEPIMSSNDSNIASIASRLNAAYLAPSASAPAVLGPEYSQFFSQDKSDTLHLTPNEISRYSPPPPPPSFPPAPHAYLHHEAEYMSRPYTVTETPHPGPAAELYSRSRQGRERERRKNQPKDNTQKTVFLNNVPSFPATKIPVYSRHSETSDEPRGHSGKGSHQHQPVQQQVKDRQPPRPKSLNKGRQDARAFRTNVHTNTAEYSGEAQFPNYYTGELDPTQYTNYTTRSSYYNPNNTPTRPVADLAIPSLSVSASEFVPTYTHANHTPAYAPEYAPIPPPVMRGSGLLRDGSRPLIESAEYGESRAEGPLLGHRDGGNGHGVYDMEMRATSELRPTAKEFVFRSSASASFFVSTS